MPTCKTASGFRPAGARATEIAASTGPMPQTCVSKRRTCASSRSVAATTSTSRTLPLRELAADLAVGVLPGVDVHVGRELRDVAELHGIELHGAHLGRLARPTERNQHVPGLPLWSEMD